MNKVKESIATAKMQFEANKKKVISFNLVLEENLKKIAAFDLLLADSNNDLLVNEITKAKQKIVEHSELITQKSIPYTKDEIERNRNIIDILRDYACEHTELRSSDDDYDYHNNVEYSRCVICDAKI